MKLSATKRRGCTHVKAARVLRVTQEHALSTGGLNLAGTPNQVGGYGDAGASPGSSVDRFKDQSWVFCKEGDLVIEVVKAGFRGKRIGYSYLTGPAIQIMDYEKARPEFFAEEPVKVGRLKIPDMPSCTGDVDVFLGEVKESVEKAKMLNGISLLELNAQGEDDAANATNILTNYWEEAPGNSHLIGVIKSSKDHGFHIHWQPKEHVGDLYANFFQTRLLLEMVKR